MPAILGDDQRVKRAVREPLAKHAGQRIRIRATFERSSVKRGQHNYDTMEQTLLFRNICHAGTGELLTEHLWFTAGSWSKGMLGGDIVEFEGRVTRYVKGYFGRRPEIYAPIAEDIRIERPTKVKVIHSPINERIERLERGST